MKLLPWVEDRLNKLTNECEGKNFSFRMKKSVKYYSKEIVFVDSQEKAESMVDLAYQRPIAYIGIDTEFKYDRDGIVIDKKRTIQDPHSIHPLILSVTLVEVKGADEANLYRFVIDLRKNEVLPDIQKLLELPVCFIGHNLKVELFCFWQLNLNEPALVWDTFAHEIALYLGKYHPKYKLKPNADEVDEIQTSKDNEEQKQFNFSLVTTCFRYGVAYPMAGDKERFQKSFLTHGDNSSFSEEQVHYASEDATAAACLYPYQIDAAARAGILQHLISVEMPWTSTSARIEWKGVKVDRDKIKNILEAINSYTPELEQRITAFGLSNIDSHKQLKEFFQKEGILEAFSRNDKYSFDKKKLKTLQHLHPVIPLIRSLRRANDIKANKIMMQEFIGTAGRIHPVQKQLGANTGRQSSLMPNILGLDSLLRPLIIPEQGMAIGEVDLSQIEIGIAAAVYHDEQLIKMFNSGDVYSVMAQNFYYNELSEEDRKLSGHEFKHKHSELRNKMKSCTLGIIYGISPRGLAQQLNITPTHAASVQNRFLSMFPSLREALERAPVYGEIRGYAYSISSLRRHRGRSGKALRWEHNWMLNFPVQCSAATIFKAAGNRLDKLYKQYDACLIVPLHDAFIFECPRELLTQVAELTERVMCETIQEFFPLLKPKVEINIDRPECWNKDGDTEPWLDWIKRELDNSIEDEQDN